MSFHTKTEYNSFVAYVFSGTGNARFIAETMAEQAHLHGLKSELNDISVPENRTVNPPDNQTLLSFFSATHGFNFPPIMLKFLFSFPRARSRTDVLIVNTRAGTKIHKLFFPGLSGIAQLFAALILIIKGYRIVGMQPMDMPSNWISLHPGLRRVVSESIIERCKRKSERVFKKIMSGKKVRKAWLSFPIDLAIAPVAFAYYFVGRFVLAKTFVASDKCNLCGLCKQQCPVKAIREVQGRMYWNFSCESCMRCLNNCPHKAIHTAHGFILGASVLMAALFTLILAELTDYLNISTDFNLFSDILINWILYPAFAILFYWLSYKLVHFLMRYRIVSLIVEYTSLTKLPFWRRYKLKNVRRR